MGEAERQENPDRHLSRRRSGVGPKGPGIQGRHKWIRGPDILTFGSGLAEAPVKWDYHGKVIELLFRSGFVGAAQDRETKAITPHVGWFVCSKDKAQPFDTE